MRILAVLLALLHQGFALSLSAPTSSLLLPQTDTSIKVPPPPTLAFPSDPTDHDLLLRAARGEKTRRTPLWMMRQAGRYMPAFRAYSEKYPFRVRSETPDIAVELSLQCVDKFGLDGCIMFSDILTPLTSMGIEWDVVRGKGPQVYTKLDSEEAIDALKPFDPSALPFMEPIISTLAEACAEKCTLLGFVGSPWTLAAYSFEGGGTKDARKIKDLMYRNPSLAHKFFDKMATLAGEYASYQVDCGSQVIQVFESWSHYLSPADFKEFAAPHAKKTIEIIKAKHPDTPVIYFANGGSGYLDLQTGLGADMISVDHGRSLSAARADLGSYPISGNVDPSVLFAPEEQVRAAVRDCIQQAGGPGEAHVMNLGHGVRQGTPEEAVGWAVDEVKKHSK